MHFWKHSPPSFVEQNHSKDFCCTLYGIVQSLHTQFASYVCIVYVYINISLKSLPEHATHIHILYGGKESKVDKRGTKDFFAFLNFSRQLTSAEWRVCHLKWIGSNKNTNFDRTGQGYQEILCV